jgi:hypothetical protein
MSMKGGETSNIGDIKHARKRKPLNSSWAYWTEL